MKTRWRHYFSRALTSSTNAKGENSETISTDLITEILLRLPGKSVARSRCVSKLWNSTLRGQYFTELFLTMSLARPRLLFSFRKDRKLCFFSAPQGESSSSPVTADYHLKFKLDDSYEVCGHVRGLVCLADLRDVKGRKGTAPVICSPSTGQLLPLPKVKTNKSFFSVRSFLGFDPTDEEFKVLMITDGIEHRVLTLGTRKLEWRMVECGIPRHHPLSDGEICINGGVYYIARFLGPGHQYILAIVCFDVRLEKCRVVNEDESMRLGCPTLVNYKGKLGALFGGSRRFELWVLEDAETHQWSKHVSVLPQPLWENLVRKAKLYIVGVAGGTDEVVLWPRSVYDPFYVYYYSMERNTLRRVVIKGMDAVSDYTKHMTLNYVEDVKFMEHV
ncbi:unnamed protein product [Microthlaspi erraticum]|uniref:F-box domain-containing protein n=1 Tax=Microthlaspi erraticum TaxID=1685480 RepID=A0A6D2J3B6_9BRAS|nr:unnamed protein product [Microthlaspi erraticum]